MIMFKHTFALACLSACLLLPVHGAQAGILGNMAKVAVAGTKANLTLTKFGLKKGAQLAKTSIKLNAAIAKCTLKAVTSKPCL